MIVWTVRVHWNMSVECIFQHLLISLKRFEFLHFLTHRPTLFLFSDWSCNGKENFGTSQETTTGSLFPIRNCHCKLLIIYLAEVCIKQDVNIFWFVFYKKIAVWWLWETHYYKEKQSCGDDEAESFLCFLLNSSFMKWELKCLDTFLQSYISWDTQTQPPNETTYYLSCSAGSLGWLQVFELYFHLSHLFSPWSW